jgi:putative proteasome-type protease
VSLLQEGFENPDTGEIDTLVRMPTMFRAAQLIGHAIRRVRSTDAEALDAARLPFEVAVLFGGQIKGGPLRLFMVYAAGNFIECSQEAPFLQIGEHKYGKPILDRAVRYSTDIYDALKIGLISIDSTMRSNLGVGLPIDIAVICRDSLDAELVHRIEAGEPYFHDLRERWSCGSAGRSHGHPASALRPSPRQAVLARQRSVSTPVTIAQTKPRLSATPSAPMPSPTITTTPSRSTSPRTDEADRDTEWDLSDDRRCKQQPY